MQAAIDSKSIREASVRIPSSLKLIGALHQALEQPDIDLNQVVKLMTMDVGISTRLLRMANSASYTRGEKVTNVEQALAWLGIFQAYRITCATMTAKLCEEDLSIYRISAEKLMLNTIATAIAMELLSKQTNLSPKTAYTIGLLSNLGRILLQRIAQKNRVIYQAPDSSDLPAVLNWETHTLGCNHAKATASLLTLWGLNPLFSSVMENLHDLDHVENFTIRRWSGFLNLAISMVTCTEYSLGTAKDPHLITEEPFLAVGLPPMDTILLSSEIATTTCKFVDQIGLKITPPPQPAHRRLRHVI